MDINEQIAKLEHRNKPATADSHDKKTFYVAPSSGELPDDGFLFYTVVTAIDDIVVAPDRSVLLFSAESQRLLECLVQFQDAFDVELYHLVGVPKTEYTPFHDAVVWNLERVSYAPFLSELSIAKDTRAQLAEKSSTTFDLEKKQYSRKDGSVKLHSALELHDDSDLDEDEDA